ncbi:MAG: hypothetical protein JSS31_03360 [Proteobacteria bacterium]|nr:hypothetical protein [Pseudomonadota bacterium]MBS0492987.1 hypothetical protein [Pseudomonadota bacterium]
MLITTLLSQHPSAIADIVRGTPAWVGALLAALIALGLSSARARRVAPARLVLLPLAMLGLALWGLQSAFGASGHLPALLALWLACFAAVALIGRRSVAPAGTAYDAVSGQFHLPGSWAPLGLILAVFSMKYLVGVQLALEPALARQLGFALAITALYGLLSGLFAVRTLRVLRSRKSSRALALS